MNRTKGFILIFTSLSLILMLVAFNSYIQNRKLDEYSSQLSDVGHHLIHLRDDIILNSYHGIKQPNIYTAELVDIENRLESLKENYTYFPMLSIFDSQDDLKGVIDEFLLCTVTLTDKLDKFIGVSVAKETTRLSLRDILSSKRNELKIEKVSGNLLTELIYQSINDTDATYYKFKKIFNDLNNQQDSLYTFLLSVGSVSFVESTEIELSGMQSNHNEILAYCILTFLLLLLAFIIALSRERVEELKRNNQAFAIEKEKAQAANQAKSLFLATMSHELRTPMNGVLGIAELIQLETKEPETKKQTQVIIDSGQHLVTLLNDILDFSKVEEGKMTLETIEFSLAEVIPHIDKALRPLAETKSLEFNITNHLSHSVRLHGDSARLRQILFNLIGNAIKFTEKGKVTVDFSAKENQLKVVVSDTGVGISADKLSTIFSPFEQAENSTTRKFGGTGLGLSIVKKITELMGGEIKVLSRENIGSKFMVLLPFEMTHKDTEKPENRQPENKQSIHRLSILMAEDNLVNAMVTKRFCEKDGHVVEHCIDAIKAIEKLKEQKFDLIIMDNHMPGMKGSDAIKVIRQELQLNTVIFACTADVFKEAHDEFLANGANFVLTKPLQSSSLNQAIEQFSTEILTFGSRAAIDNVVPLLRCPPEQLVMTEEELSQSPLLHSALYIKQEERVELLQAFVADFEKNIDGLISAYSRGDIESLVAILIAIHSTSVDFAMPELQHLSELNITFAKKKEMPDLNSLQKLINRLLVNSHQAQRMLDRWSEDKNDKLSKPH